MNQEITYSSTLINYLYSDQTILEISDQKKVWELIKQNYVVCDSDLKILDAYGEIVKSLPTSVLKQELQNFIDGLITDKAKKRKIFSILPSVDSLEINLALSSKDKIYFNAVFNEEEINEYVIKYNEIEVHNSRSFIHPLPQHRLKHLPTIIPLKDGVFYDIVKIVNPFIRHTKYIQIEDQYLPNKRASYNLFKVIENFPDIEFKLIFLTKYKFLEYKIGNEREEIEKRYDQFIKRISDLNKKGYKISYEDCYKIKKHRDRYIFTEEFQILVPGGFDFLNEKGYMVNTDYDKPERREIIIEKRNFPLDNK